MYEELVKRLREIHPEEFGDAWDFAFACQQTMHEAADAIEELRKKVDEWQEEACKWNNEYYHLLDNMPRWIPVTERLPKTRESILGKKSSKVIVAFRFNDGTQGTDTAHTLNGEWVFEDHITVVARTITHWMPLPEPPKEETR